MKGKILRGKVHKFGDDINTDYIISGRYKFKTLNLDELVRHIFEDIHPGFYNRITPGDFIVAGENFGCGSSREQAPLVIKHAKIGAVLARSFARIFYRNAINTGLPIIITQTDKIKQGDILQIDLGKGEIKIENRGISLSVEPFAPEILKIIESGGLVEYFKKYGGWSFSP